MELIFTCGEFLWIPEDPVSQIHSPHPHVGAPGIFSDLIRYVHMLKRERDVREAMGSYRTYSSLIKLQSWFLSLRCKTCLRQNYSIGSCACSEGPALCQNTMIYYIVLLYYIILYYIILRPPVWYSG